MTLSKIAGSIVCSVATLLLAGCGATIEESVGGTVTGLSGGTQVVLLDNGGDPLTVGANGSFTFGKQISSGSAYAVTVQIQPIGETCTVSNGTGTVSQAAGGVTNVAISCSANVANYNYVSGTVSGLATGTSVTLLNDGATPLPVTANGPFTFPTAVAVGSAYYVTVSANPAGKTCVATTNASGTVPANGSSTGVVVTCN